MPLRKNPPDAVTEIHFDTNAISKLLSAPPMIAALARMSSREDWIVIVSWTVFMELLATPSGDWLIKNVAGLLNIFEQLGGRFRIGRGVDEIFLLELEERIHQTPLLPPELEAEVRSSLYDIVAANDPAFVDRFGLHRRIEDWKRAREKEDIEARRETREEFRRAQLTFAGLVEFLKLFSPQSLPEWMYARVMGQVLQRPSYPVSKLQRETGRYQCIRAWTSLIGLVMMGDSLPTDILNQHPMGNWLRSDRNNYYDAAVAAAAAYGSVFVTQDKGLTERCRFLRNRRCLHFAVSDVQRLLE